MKPERVEQIRKAQALRRLGLTFQIIGSRLGVSTSTAKALVADGKALDRDDAGASSNVC